MICYHLGTVPYSQAWELQKSMARLRGQQECADTLLLLEHPHTYTLGSSGKVEHLLLTEAERAARGIAVYEVDRGGDITYHGPGQLVGYPIIQLAHEANGLRTDVVAYVRQLEAVLIDVIGQFGIQGQRLEGYTGVWVDHQDTWQKVAAIGVKVTTRRVTFHGFALNVNTDLSYFQGIVPCGIPDKPVTSLQALCGHRIDMDAVITATVATFGRVFGQPMTWGNALALEIRKYSE